MLRVYLDWNCLKGIKNPNKNEFEILKSWIDNHKDKIVLYYSPSHLADLNKNYNEQKEKIDEDLIFLQQITENNIIAKYFGKPEITIEQRELIPFFHEIRKDKENEEPVESIIENLQEEIGLNFDDLFKSAGVNLKDLIPNDSEFEDSETSSQIKKLFSGLFQNGDFNSLLKDVSKLNSTFQNQPTEFNNLRKNLQADLNLDSNVSNWDSVISKLDLHLTNTLLGKSFSNSVIEDVKRFHKNPTYFDYYISTYNHLGLFGYRPEKLTEKNRFNNSIEDAFHSFYGANSDVFLTNDKTLYYRSKLLFEAFEVKSKILKTFKIENSDLFKKELESLTNE